MSDNKKKRGTPDSKRIDISEAYEKEYWKKELGISGQQLAGAIKAVGTSVKNVKEYLKDK